MTASSSSRTAAGSRDCLTADRVTALQAFRDLFSGDVLRPGDEVSIGQVTLMFTDLKGSTALYEKIGDAAAYHLVRDHFAFLAEQVRDHERRHRQDHRRCGDGGLRRSRWMR